MKRFLIVAAASLIAASAGAQDLHSIAPPQILQMDSLPNAGELFIRYCMLGNHLCVERSTSCHGQCCSQSEADSVGYGCSGDVYSVVPPGSHYAGWVCRMYGKADPAIATEGDAGPTPHDLKYCTNPR